MKYFTLTVFTLLVCFMGSSAQAEDIKLSTKACTFVFHNESLPLLGCLRMVPDFQKTGTTDFEAADVVCGQYYRTSQVTGVAQQKACEEAVLGHFVNPVRTACGAVKDADMQTCITNAKMLSQELNANQPQSDLSVAVIYVCAGFDGKNINRTVAEAAACDKAIAASRK